METIEKTITSTSDLSWVAETGGPEITLGKHGLITGMPEEGWRHYEYNGDKREISLQLEHTEPTTGMDGTLILDLSPSSPDVGVNWAACFLFYTPARDPGGARDGHIPVRARGRCATFAEAHAAALAWRPAVQVIDGVELWTDPTNMRGEARGLRSGRLTWHPAKESEGCIDWRFKPAGIEELGIFDWYCQEIGGTAETPEQMLEQVSVVRDRLRSALRNYLLNF